MNNANWPPSWAAIVSADELDRLSVPGAVPPDRSGQLEDLPVLEMLKRLRAQKAPHL